MTTWVTVPRGKTHRRDPEHESFALCGALVRDGRIAHVARKIGRCERCEKVALVGPTLAQERRKGVGA